MKPFIKIMFISTLAAVSSAQATLQTGSGESGPNGLKNLEDRVIIAETYSSQGAFAVINGNIQSGTYTSLGAGNFLLPNTGGSTGNPARYGPFGLGIYAGTIRGDVYSGTSTSTGDGAVVHGDISSGVDAANTADGFTMIGANGAVGGDIHSDTYTSIGASALIKGDITALSATTGANAIIQGAIQAKNNITLGSGSTAGGTDPYNLATPLAPNVASRASIIGDHQEYFKTNAGGLLAISTYTTAGSGTFGAFDTTFYAGVHDFADILSFTANKDINLQGNGSDQDWIFNVGNYMSLGANVNVNLIGAGAGSRVIWNVLGDSTGGAGLGYASLGAGVNFIGEILANSYISVGADYAHVQGVNDTCGGLYSKTGYVSVGATSIVGGTGCGETVADLPVVVDLPTPATALLFGLGLGLVGLVGVARRKKA
jgi:MSHA biogenesis protein MshQ